MTEIPHGDVDTQTGVWKGLRKGDGTRSATVSCPICAECATLTGHEIFENGVVQPSLVCPDDDCHFHDYVTLLNWAPVT